MVRPPSYHLFHPTVYPLYFHCIFHCQSYGETPILPFVSSHCIPTVYPLYFPLSILWWDPHLTICFIPLYTHCIFHCQSYGETPHTICFIPLYFHCILHCILHCQSYGGTPILTFVSSYCIPTVFSTVFSTVNHMVGPPS